MRIFLAGGAGFVGSRMAEHFAAKGHEVKCLVRRSCGVQSRPGITFVQGDILSDGLAHAMMGAEAAVNLVGIIRDFPRKGITFEKLHVEAAQKFVSAAQNAGVQRILHMSANGARPDGVSRYHRTKAEAEETVKNSGLEWTIFRPSLIFGEPPEGKMEFCTQLARNFRNAPVIPVFGDGNYRLQPIHVSDVAEAFEKSLTTPGAVGRVFHLGGDVTYSYREILNMIFLGMGLGVRPKFPVPWLLAKPFVAILGNLDWFPATAEQIDMLMEGNTIPENEFKKFFGMELIPFTVANLDYLKRVAEFDNK